MKAKMLIKELREMIRLHGDHDVLFMDGSAEDRSIMVVCAYDEDGNGQRDPEFKGISKFVVH